MGAIEGGSGSSLGFRFWVCCGFFGLWSFKVWFLGLLTWFLRVVQDQFKVEVWGLLRVSGSCCFRFT